MDLPHPNEKLLYIFKFPRTIMVQIVYLMTELNVLNELLFFLLISSLAFATDLDSISDTAQVELKY